MTDPNLATLHRLLAARAASAAGAATVAGHVLQVIRWRTVAELPTDNRTVVLWLRDEPPGQALVAGWYEAQTSEWLDAAHGGAIPPAGIEAWADVPGPGVQGDQDWQRDDELTFIMLQLVPGLQVPATTVAGWSNADCQQAEAWAIAMFQRSLGQADVVVPPQPVCLYLHALQARAG